MAKYSIRMLKAMDSKCILSTPFKIGNFEEIRTGNFLGGPVAGTSPSNAGCVGSVPGRGTKGPLPPVKKSKHKTEAA